MKRRSFLQAMVAAIFGLPAVFSTKTCPATVSIDCKLVLIEECKETYTRKRYSFDVILTKPMKVENLEPGYFIYLWE